MLEAPVMEIQEACQGKANALCEITEHMICHSIPHTSYCQYLAAYLHAHLQYLTLHTISKSP
jgi:hypothetical protein